MKVLVVLDTFRPIVRRKRPLTTGCGLRRDSHCGDFIYYLVSYRTNLRSSLGSRSELAGSIALKYRQPTYAQIFSSCQSGISSHSSPVVASPHRLLYGVQSKPRCFPTSATTALPGFMLLSSPQVNENRTQQSMIQ